MYIYERPEWPHLQWDQAAITNELAELRHMQGRLLGRMEALGFSLREAATLQMLTEDAMKTSEIEGETLDTAQVRSSIARRLGIPIADAIPVSRNVEGIVEVLLDATSNYTAPLTEDRLFGWHAALFPTGRSGMQRIKVGHWRDESGGPMQVISGAYGREKVHFEAPSYDRLEAEMCHFLAWINAVPTVDLVVQAALAHFWFVTIHPFDDGNGRIGRAIADMVLARSEQCGQRFYSMSGQIQRERNDYYDILEQCQKGSVDITRWISWFLQCMKRAIMASHNTLEAILTKARFWETHAGSSFNERQRLVINRLLDGFEGKLTSSKWATLTKASPDTALRDITDLLHRNILMREEGGGRSTSYRLVHIA